MSVLAVVLLMLAAVVVGAWIAGVRSNGPLARAEARRASAEGSADQLRVQLANVGAAARGVVGTKVEDRASYGWSPAYRDVVDLRRELEAMHRTRDHALRILAQTTGCPMDVDQVVGVLEASKAAAFGPLAVARRFKTAQEVVDYLKLGNDDPEEPEGGEK